MCPAEDVTTPSGVYHLELSNPGIYDLDCPSGHNGTAVVECSGAFAWGEIDEECSRCGNGW